jgi:hypothetical protein
MYPSLTPKPEKKDLGRQLFATIQPQKKSEIVSNIPQASDTKKIH